MKNPYIPKNIPLFEALYGKHLISLGGTAAIDNMFSDLNINGLTALDLGFGLGGVAFYLAEKYGMKITGVEVHAWMAQHANSCVSKELVSQLKFTTYNSQNELPFKLNSFDMVYSKGVLNHIHNKENLFNQINTILKPNGLFVIADWIFPKFDNSEILICETRESYEKILKNTGFNTINFRDDSKLFLNHVELFLENLAKQQTFIENEYGKEIYATVLQEHLKLIDNIKHQDKYAVRILAKK